MTVFFSMSAQTEIAPESDALTASTLRYNYYEDKCERDVEEIVWPTMHRIVLMQHNAPAQLLRLLFHDCFVGGCGASVLLADSSKNGTVEREAIPTRTLKGFNFIDMIKDEIEEACSGVVSCSDITCPCNKRWHHSDTMTAGGPYYPVLTGRRDSTESFFDKAMAEIPRPNGGHNIGKIGCEFIRPRLSNFMGTNLPDPTIPCDFLEELKRKCPDNNNTINNMFNEHTARSLSEHAMSYSQGLFTVGA
uniref:peroxidase n=1 Tax=Nicotiana tabacum TaxID=4097 RepID=A0A1S3X3R1_TOBAC|nr:PREDICTED: putative Peroxidase 48 [Nicotiana tabacum]